MATVWDESCLLMDFTCGTDLIPAKCHNDVLRIIIHIVYFLWQRSIVLKRMFFPFVLLHKHCLSVTYKACNFVCSHKTAVSSEEIMLTYLDYFTS